VPESAQAIVLVVLIAVVAVAAGLGLGIVVAPRIGRALDRADRDDEEAGDGPD
jgi:hypothetical protein